jgi:F-type H+-transporting ATPase subunit b
MPQLDVTTFAPQLFWLAVSFIVLYFLMTKMALPRVGAAIAERRARIDGDLERAAQMKSDAEEVMFAYERALAEARAQAQETVRQTSEKLAAEAAERQRAAGAKLAEQTAAAEKRIAAAREAALTNVRSIAIDVARTAAQRLTGAEIDEARAGAAVDAVMKGRA